MMLVLVLLAALLARISAECANGCNGHGKCTSYDMCICNRNWQANDCSERVCMYGLAHVDTPKGDLDMSGAVSGPETKVIDNSFTYPYGTTEQFPQMEDSDLKELTNSAHYYMECSNKGTCDRATGECACFDGYDGVACQRASCPGGANVCSGHGVCMSAAQIATSDSNNRYLLWDKDTTMGCNCDAGYYGPSCTEKKCKVGVDPLYLDDSATVKYSTYDFATLTTAPAAATTETNGYYHTDDGVLLNDGTATGGRGYWAIRFFDATGEDWVTSPIEAGASCNKVVSMLEALPNNVIPTGSMYCTRSWNIGQIDNEWSTTGGIGSSGVTLYDAQHSSTSAHPYKINYRMSIWDAYASSNSYEDIGEGGLYTSLNKYPGSFGVNPAVISVVAGTTASSLVFTTTNAAYEVGMLLTRIDVTGAATRIGVVSVVDVATTIAGVNTFTITFVGTSTTLDAKDVIVGQIPIISGTAATTASSNTITTLTPGFKAGMYLSVAGAAPVEITSVTSSTSTSTPYVTTYTLTASSITGSSGAALKAFGTYTVSGVLYAALTGNDISVTTKTPGFAIGMLASLGGASMRITGVSSVSSVYTIAFLETPSINNLAINAPITGTSPAKSDVAIELVADNVGGSALILTTTQTASIYASNYCGTISAGMLAAPSLKYKLPRVIRSATSNGAVVIGHSGTSGGVSSTTLTVATGNVKAGRLVTGMTISGTGIAAGTTVTCPVALGGASLNTYLTNGGSCTMSVANTITALTVITATMPVIMFTATIAVTTGVVTITNVAQGPVVTGLLFTSIATSAAADYWIRCPTPIGTGAVGTCTAYASANGSIYATAVSTTTFVASTYKPSYSTCMIVVDGIASGLTASSHTASVFPIFKGYTASGVPSAGVTSANIVVTTTTGFATGMSLACTGTCAFTTPRTITGVTPVVAAGGYSITFTGPSVSFATSDKLEASYVGAGFGETARVALTGYIYRLKFYGNPGALKQPEIVTHLDGKRNSLMSINYAVIDPGTSKDYRVITKVWTDGQQGENEDYFADHCDGVQVTIGNKWVSTNGNDLSTSSVGADTNRNTAAKFFLNSLSSAEKALLKKCLGDSDFDTTNNRDVYNWDWGYDETNSWDNPIRYPHLIKLVRSVTTYTDGGYYAAIYFSETDTLDSLGSGGTFYLLNPFSPPDAFATDSYEVYTTKGTLALTSNNVAAHFGFGSKTIYTVDPRADPTKGTTSNDIITTTATTTTDSTTITYASALNLEVGMTVSGRGIRANTVITAVISSTAVTVNIPVQTGGSSLSLTFSKDYNGDLSCEIGLSDANKATTWESAITKTLTTQSSAYVCLNKTDIITFLNVDYPSMNPPHLNLYTVNRLFKDVPHWSDYERYGAAATAYLDTNYAQGHSMTYMSNQISLDISTNWGNSVGSSLNSISESSTTAAGGLAENSKFRIYKFYPAVASTYEYVAPCSNRGLCNTDSGVCECFAGYTSDNCHEQSSLAL